MKLANTLIIESTTLPNTKKAFTLAETLITLAILGVVAAITVPALIRNQSEKSAIVKMHKSIATYEKAAGNYLAETGEKDLSGMIGSENCDKIKGWFKTKNSSWTTDLSGSPICAFTTSDNVFWMINTEGNAVVLDTPKKPKYGVVMWVQNGRINGENIDNNEVPDESYIPDAPEGSAEGNYGDFADSVAPPIHGYYTAAQMINLRKPDKNVTGAESSKVVVNNLNNSSPTGEPEYDVIGSSNSGYENCRNINTPGCSCVFLGNEQPPVYSCWYYPSASAATIICDYPECDPSYNPSPSSDPSPSEDVDLPMSSYNDPQCSYVGAPNCFCYPTEFSGEPVMYCYYSSSPDPSPSSDPSPSEDVDLPMSSHSDPQCSYVGAPNCFCYPTEEGGVSVMNCYYTGS